MPELQRVFVGEKHTGSKETTMLNSAYQKVIEIITSEDIIFPPSLQNALELRKLLLDPNIDLATLTICIRKDPIISLAVLKLANSPMYVRQVKELKDAISFLGLSALNYVLFGILQKQLSHVIQGSLGSELVKQIWQYSLDVAGSTFAIAKTESTDLVAEESILLALTLHLDLMFATYAVAKTGLVTEYQEYAIFIRRIAHTHRNKLMALYGVCAESAQNLSHAYWAYPAEYLPAPITAIEALSMGINSTEIPFALRVLLPSNAYSNTLTTEQFEHKSKVTKSLNF